MPTDLKVPVEEKKPTMWSRTCMGWAILSIGVFLISPGWGPALIIFGLGLVICETYDYVIGGSLDESI